MPSPTRFPGPTASPARPPLSLTGTGTVILTNTNSYTGPTTIGPGATLQLGNGSAGNDGNITSTHNIVDNGTLVYNLFGAAAVRRRHQRLGGRDACRADT